MKRALLAALLLASTPARADFADHFARRTDIPHSKAPVFGHSQALVLPLEVAGHPALDRAGLEAYFGPGGVFRTYFANASGGKYQVDATVAPTVHYDTCPLPAEFTNCTVPRGNTDALGPALDVLRDALARTVDAGVDFRAFDQNGLDGVADGTIDGLLLITNIDFGGIALPIVDLNHGDNLDGGVGGAFIVDGTKLPYISIGGTQEVLLHEFGHQLGLTDLYDEDDGRGGLELSLMGNWNYDDKPLMPDAESRYRMAWAPAVHVTQSATVTLKPAEQGGGMLRVGGDTEYFLLENRGPNAALGLDRSLPDRGVAVYHIDRAVGPQPDEGGFVSRLLHCVNCDWYHPYTMNLPKPGKPFHWLDPHMVESDELFGVGDALGADPDGDVQLSAQHTVPSTNWYSGQRSGIELKVLSRQGDDFQIQVTVPASDCAAPEACPSGSVCPVESCYVAPPPPGSTQPKRGCSCAGVEAGWGGLGLLAWAARRRRGRGPTSC